MNKRTMHDKDNVHEPKNSIWMHLLFIGLIGVSAAWLYNSLDNEEKPPTLSEKKATVVQSVERVAAENLFKRVENNDDAVGAYLRAAQNIAEAYQYTNSGSYAGLCEESSALYTLEGGILKHIKMVGATEVFCTTGDTSYMIEALLPISGVFYCIDSTGARGDRATTSEGQSQCVAAE